jgi:hypothetical protein
VTGGDGGLMLRNPQKFYTPEYQAITRAKVARINASVLLLQGEPTRSINGFNEAVFVQELRAADKAVTGALVREGAALLRVGTDGGDCPSARRRMAADAGDGPQGGQGHAGVSRAAARRPATAARWNSSMNAPVFRACLHRSVFAALVFCAIASPGYAQWLDHRTPGIPRTPDGSPHLDAAPPRLADGRPDLQGNWTTPWTAIMPPAEALQPWAKELMQHRHETFFKERPAYRCLPSGPEVNNWWRRIVQTPALVAILNENLTYRTIFLDGRALESDPHPTWMGYSVGRWEGDVLVVESSGFNNKTWLNQLGLPHTTGLRLVERYIRRSLGRMELELTITDPGTFTRSWTATVPMELRADTEMLETACEEGSDRWTGTLSEIQTYAVSVSREVLARYVGVYRGMWGPNVRTVRVTLDGDILRANGVHDQDVQLIPESATFFAGTDGLTYEFVGAGSGPATQLIERHVSGDYTYGRQD